MKTAYGGKRYGFTLVEVMFAATISVAVGGFVMYLMFTTARSAKAFQSQSVRQGRLVKV